MQTSGAQHKQKMIVNFICAFAETNNTEQTVSSWCSHFGIVLCNAAELTGANESANKQMEKHLAEVCGPSHMELGPSDVSATWVRGHGNCCDFGRQLLTMPKEPSNRADYKILI